jgi:hypothetical protein
MKEMKTMWKKEREKQREMEKKYRRQERNMMEERK